MSAKPTQAAGTMIPCLGYHDARAAIEWLGRAFRFRPRAVYDGPDGKVAHAELAFGRPWDDHAGFDDGEGPFAKLLVHPDQIGGKQTQSPYVIVDDADAILRHGQSGSGPRSSSTSKMSRTAAAGSLAATWRGMFGTLGPMTPGRQKISAVGSNGLLDPGLNSRRLNGIVWGCLPSPLGALGLSGG